MLKKFYSRLLLFTVILSLVLAAGCSSSETSGDQASGGDKGEERVFKIAHTASESHVWSKTMEKFNEELKARSDGRLSLEIYLNSSLGNNADMMDQMKTGVLDMAFIPAAELTNHFPSFNAWFMPFVLTDLDQVYEMSKTDEAQAILDTINEDEHGIHSLGYAHVGMRDVLMKDKAIVKPENFKDSKIRVSSSPVTVDFWKQMGSSPVSMPLGEVYTAFQTGVVDGIDIDMMALVSQKFYEVGKELTLTNHMAYQGVAFFSKPIWDELSDEDKKIIEESFAVAQQFNQETSIADEEALVEEFEANGGKVNELKDNKAFKELSVEFIKQYSKEDPLIDAFVKKAEEIGSK